MRTCCRVVLMAAGRVMNSGSGEARKATCNATESRKAPLGQPRVTSGRWKALSAAWGGSMGKRVNSTRSPSRKPLHLPLHGTSNGGRPSPLEPDIVQQL